MDWFLKCVSGLLAVSIVVLVCEANRTQFSPFEAVFKLCWVQLGQYQCLPELVLC